MTAAPIPIRAALDAAVSGDADVDARCRVLRELLEAQLGELTKQPTLIRASACAARLMS
jgi:hypothetical protein